MRSVSIDELKESIAKKKPDEKLEFREVEIHHADLTGWNLSGIDFTLSSFHGSILNGVNFCNSSVENALFDGCPLHGADFRNANMKTASFRYCDLEEANICGANLFGAVLEYARLDGILSDDRTQWFRMHCPATGPILGYKKCVNDRLVQLLIPTDAKRTSATLPSCRCNKAKVLTIKSFDSTEEFEEAWSLVDENFVYRKGQWVEVIDFNEDRWMDSTTGIHFWMTREEAIEY